jgi:hypothetical protein
MALTPDAVRCPAHPLDALCEMHVTAIAVKRRRAREGSPAGGSTAAPQRAGLGIDEDCIQHWG